MEQTNGTRWERPDAPLGTLVYRAGLLSKDKLEAALEEGQRTGRRLGEILLQKGWIDEKDLARLLAGQKGLQFVSLKGRGYERDTAKLLPERVCRYHTAVPVESSAARILVAIADPTDESAVQEIRDELDRPVELLVAATSEIRGVLDEVFGPGAAGQNGPGLDTSGVAPALSAITPVGELGLRIAAPPPTAPAPAPEASPEPEPVEAPAPAEPVAEEPAPEAEPAPSPLPVAEAEPAEPVEAPADPDPPAAPAVVLPTLASVSESTPEGPAPAVEPTIERNEDAHVSVAFHQPVTPLAPAPEPAEPVATATPDVAVTPASEETAPTTSAPESTASAPALDPDAPRPGPAEAPFRLVLNLVGGDEVEVAYFADSDEATAAARELVAGIAGEGDWPQVGRTFYPPERIASVEIRERQRFAGSASRGAWGASDERA